MTITQQSISTFLELQEAIKAEALRINNMLNDAGHDFSSDWCGVELDYLDCDIDERNALLTYHVPFEDYDETWIIPTDYIGLSDEEILAIAQEEWENLTKSHKEREIACLKRQAEMFGYELKEK